MTVLEQKIVTRVTGEGCVWTVLTLTHVSVNQGGKVNYTEKQPFFCVNRTFIYSPKTAAQQMSVSRYHLTVLLQSYKRIRMSTWLYYQV